MQKTKESKINKIIKKSQFIIIGSFLIFIGIIIISSKYICNYYLNKEEESKIGEFYKVVYENDNENKEELKKEQKQEIIQKNKTSYIAVIKIPKIKLEKGLYEKESLYNDVNKNVQMLKESDYPNIENGNFILASHSGNSRISYFKDLDKLSQNDEVSIVYKEKEYKYKIVNIYDVEKTGTVNIIKNKERTTLTLITCKENTNKQIVVICELVEILCFNES